MSDVILPAVASDRDNPKTNLQLRDAKRNGDVNIKINPHEATFSG